MAGLVHFSRVFGFFLVFEQEYIRLGYWHCPEGGIIYVLRNSMKLKRQEMKG